MLRDVIVAVAGGLIVALPGYLLIVKVNEVKIAHMEKEIVELKKNEKNTEKSLFSTKLFIAQAHPDRDASNLNALIKLKNLDSQELELMAEFLPEVKIGPAPDNEIIKLPKQLKGLTMRQAFDGDDLLIFGDVIAVEIQDPGDIHPMM